MYNWTVYDQYACGAITLWKTVSSAYEFVKTINMVFSYCLHVLQLKSLNTLFETEVTVSNIISSGSM